jgi:hypothetical protein
MKKIIAALSLALLLAAGTANADMYIDMNIGSPQPNNASVSFDGVNSDPLIGSNISVAYLLGNETPSNSNTQIALQNAVLNFSTGAFVSLTGNTWTFGPGGTISVTGGSSIMGISPSSTLLTGSFNQATVTNLGSGMYQFDIAGGTFSDTKNNLIYSYLGLPLNTVCFGGLNLSFTPNINTTGDAIQSVNVLSGDIYNTPTPTTPIPAAAWLFGSGLMGLLGLKRRKA